MPTFRVIATNAMMEIGALGQGETPSAADASVCLYWGQMMVDSWAADRLTLSIQSATTITWPAATATQTIGPGGDINVQRPVWINNMNYVNPGSSPEQEVPMGQQNEDQFSQNTIKLLQSGLPQQYFYQTSIDTVLGTLQIWPVPNQQMTLKLYAPQAVTVPISLDSVLMGPPGYLQAYHYQLALRLMTPFSKRAEDCPLLVGPGGFAAMSFANMKKQNVEPGLLGCDPALIPRGSGGYNVLSDSISAPSAH